MHDEEWGLGSGVEGAVGEGRLEGGDHDDGIDPIVDAAAVVGRAVHARRAQRVPGDRDVLGVDLVHEGVVGVCAEVENGVDDEADVCGLVDVVRDLRVVSAGEWEGGDGDEVARLCERSGVVQQVGPVALPAMGEHDRGKGPPELGCTRVVSRVRSGSASPLRVGSAAVGREVSTKVSSRTVTSSAGTTVVEDDASDLVASSSPPQAPATSARTRTVVIAVARDLDMPPHPPDPRALPRTGASGTLSGSAVSGSDRHAHGAGHICRSGPTPPVSRGNATSNPPVRRDHAGVGSYDCSPAFETWPLHRAPSQYRSSFRPKGSTAHIGGTWAVTGCGAGGSDRGGGSVAAEVVMPRRRHHSTIPTMSNTQAPRFSSARPVPPSADSPCGRDDHHQEQSKAPLPVAFPPTRAAHVIHRTEPRPPVPSPGPHNRRGGARAVP